MPVEFAGTTVTVTLGGPGYQTTDINATFARTGVLVDQASWSGEVSTTPEPATYAFVAGGLMALGFARRCRRS